MSTPVGQGVVIEDTLQRIGGDSTTQLAIEISKQVRVRQVQDPDRVVVTFRCCVNRRAS
jgi:hypothetical protein